MNKKDKEATGKPIYSPRKQKILLLLAAGQALALSRASRRQLKVIGNLPRAWKQVDQKYLQRIVREFYNDRLVDWQEDKDGIIKMTITEKGKRKVNEFDPDKLEIAKPKKWDGKWRVVIYDIPHAKKSARDALRYKLYELGFKEWQKSVFIHPYECKDQIEFIVEFFDYIHSWR